MPGISIMYSVTNPNKNRVDNGAQELFLESSKSIVHNNSYKREILLKEDSYVVICTRYPEYPIKILDNNKFWVCIEGKFYGKNDSKIDDEIFDLIQTIHGTNLSTHDDKKRVADWLQETDGDFIIYALNKSNKDFIIMNDLLGRLPLYYTYRNGSELIVSREIQLMSMIQNYHEGGNKFDMMGIAQFLMFRHTLGTRTLLNDVARLEPASLLSISISKLRLEMKIHNLYAFNFENKQHADQSVKRHVNELVPLFLDACKNRVDDKARNIVSLSGGFDSRAVAMSLVKNKMKCYAVTSPEPSWKPVMGSLSETEVAESLAKTMHIELEKYDALNPQAKDLVTLLRSKDGMVYLRHGFLVRLLEEIRYKHTSSRINYFTGHGGDTLFDVFSTGAKDIDDCVRRILFKQGLFSFREIIALTNIEERELRAEIKKILSLFPEEKPAEKMKHFVFFEESLRFSYEIEDLNRFYFWSVCPFYSVPFFKYIINCSDESKARLALYREFLQAISPEAAAISNSDWGCPITSMKFKIFQHMLYFLMKHKTVRKLLRKATNKGAHSKAHNYQRNSPTIRCLSEQVSNCDAISNYLSLMTMKKILNNSTHYTYTAIDNLLTITSLLEESLCSRSAINKYF